MTGREKIVVCRELAKQCRNGEKLCTLTKLWQVYPPLTARCIFTKGCGCVTMDDWYDYLVSSKQLQAAVENYQRLILGGPKGR